MENSRIEYKRELTDGLEKEVVAFLNAREGGILSIGIDKDGDVFGVKDCDKLQLAIKDRLRNIIQPSVMEFFSDRAEVISMGGLPYGVTEKDFFGGKPNSRLQKYRLTENGKALLAAGEGGYE